MNDEAYFFGGIALGVGLTACSGSQTDFSDVPIREVVWEFCGEDVQGNSECFDGTEIVWVAPDIDSPPEDFIELTAYLVPNMTGHNTFIEAYGCFPRYDEPQGLDLYNTGNYITRQHDEDDDSIFQRPDVTEIDVLEVRPLSEHQVQAEDKQTQMPIVAMTSGMCRTRNS